MRNSNVEHVQFAELDFEEVAMYVTDDTNPTEQDTFRWVDSRSAVQYSYYRHVEPEVSFPCSSDLITGTDIKPAESTANTATVFI